MRVVMVGKQKGGVGGSTVVREVAVAAAADGLRVVIIDLDPQATVSRWWSRRTKDATGDPNPGLAAPAPEALAATLDALRARKVDLVLLDTPPSIHPFIAATMRLVDYVLVPTGPTYDDVEALPPVLEMIEAAGKPFGFLITKAPPGRSRLVDDTVPILARRGLVAPMLRQRTDFPAAARPGLTAFEATGSKAAQEVAELWGWLRDNALKGWRRKAKAGAVSS